LHTNVAGHNNHNKNHSMMSRRFASFCSAFVLLLAAVVVAQAQQDLIPLTIVGAEGTLNEADFPLSKCQGDCNRNADCDGFLLCFSRGGATTIPGCSGRAALDGTDYCWDPTDKPIEGVIAHVGNNGNPSVLYPLGRCHGQCSSDDDCATGLVCLVREKVTDPVYGCEGPLLDRTDYCVNPGDIPGSTVGTPTVPTTTDDANTTTTTTDGGISVDGADDTYMEPLKGVLTILYLGGAVNPNTTEPLGECQGNCGLDVECAADLVCYNRTNETVPGCGGILLPNIHYCVKDPLAAPLDDLELDHPSLKGILSIAIYEGLPAESLPLQHCQGDCKSHDMCDQATEPMACFERESLEGDVPGCTGIALKDIAYCVKAADLVKEEDSSEPGKSGNAALWSVLGAILPTLALYCVE
jgi:hypothetical protein